MKYEILKSRSIVGLQDTVENYLSKGWDLRGNIIVFNRMLIQQMVKCEPKCIPVKDKIEPNVKVGENWYVTVGNKKFAELALIEDLTEKTVQLCFALNHSMIDRKRYDKSCINFLERRDK